ncbi:DUF6364 family protein [uncultured Arcticibacterium sp.]|uniref:DUF6364 family protein n=1 Tax=uncultured Arcticibacterium sp. TaxID=2173042 RepID=UPI0030F77A3F
MDAKLTLKLNEEVIAQAKEYAKTQKRSLSRIIEDYLKAVSGTEQTASDLEISPYVKSMSVGKSIASDSDDKEEIRNYLLEKYK